MSSPREVYEAWEREAPSSVVHVLQLDRGDRSPEHRLTLTDQPYYDWGVNGEKYHDTYPAPIHCIVSTLRSRETRGQTTFDDIVVVNENGRFNSIFSDENLLEHEGVMLRGDTRWSLMETKYPYRFLTIFRVKVAAVNFDHEHENLIISVTAKPYRLGYRVASANSPLAIGRVFNAPAVLVNSASHQYRSNSILTFQESSVSDESYRLRDKGADLGNIHDTSDYTIDLEDGVFKGLFTLGEAPEGQVTGDINFGFRSNHFVKLAPLIRRTVHDYLVDDYPVHGDTYDALDAHFLDWTDNGNILIRSRDNWLDRYDASSPYVLASVGSLVESKKLTDVSDSANIKAVQWGENGSVVWVMFSNGLLRQYSLSTAYTLSTLSYTGNTFFTSGYSGTGQTVGFWIFPDDEYIYLVNEDGHFSLSNIIGGDPSTIADIQTCFYAPAPVDALAISPVGDHAYFLNAASFLIHQYDALAVKDFTEGVKAGRSYFIEWAARVDQTLLPESFVIIEGSLFILDVDNVFHQVTGIDRFDLPLDLFHVNLFDGKENYYGGVFYNQETEIGQILSDLVSCWITTYTVTREGTITAIRLKDPNTYTLEPHETLYTLRLNNFIGDIGQHIKHEEMVPARYKVTLYYDQNFTVQSGSELAGSAQVDEDSRKLYSEPYKVASAEVNLPDYDNPQELPPVNTYLSTGETGSTTQVEDILDDENSVVTTNRFLYKFVTELKSTSLLSDFGIGSIVEISGDVRSHAFSDGDRSMVVERDVNWSENVQELLVFK